jgi:hypothetical protein
MCDDERTGGERSRDERVRTAGEITGDERERVTTGDGEVICDERTPAGEGICGEWIPAGEVICGERMSSGEIICDSWTSEIVAHEYPDLAMNGRGP